MAPLELITWFLNTDPTATRSGSHRKSPSGSEPATHVGYGGASRDRKNLMFPSTSNRLQISFKWAMPDLGNLSRRLPPWTAMRMESCPKNGMLFGNKGFYYPTP